MLSVAAVKVEAKLTELGWGQVDLANEIKARGHHVAEGLVSRWLQGTRTPTLAIAPIIDEVLGLDVLRLWAQPADKPKPKRAKRRAA